MTLMGSLAMGALTASAAAENRPVHVFLSVAIAPDGKHVASIEGDATPSGAVDIKSVVIRSADGTEAAPVTLPCGQVRECAPSSLAWAPDGKSLAFALRLPGGHDHDIYAVPPSGGAPSRIAAVDGTVGRLRYSPQGVLAALVTAGAEKEVGAVEAGAPVAGVLGSDVHEQRIAIIGKDGKLGWASPPDLFVYEFDWRPDGSGFVGTAAPGDGDNHWWIAKLYAFDAKTGGAKGGGRVIYTPANPRQQLADPRISRDGKSVSFIGGIMSDFGSTGGDAFVLPLDQQGASATNITPKLHATVTALAWDCDGKTLMASELAADQRRIVTLDPAGQAAARVLASSQEDLRGTDDPLSVACGTGQAAIAHMSFTKPPEIEMGAPGAWHDVTRANAGIVAPVAATSVTWKNEGLSVQGWLLTPIGVPADKKLAMITEVHGGPGAANEPFFVGAGYVKKLLDAGYALFLPNPRGSFGQGEAFTLGNVRDLGHGDLRDILAGVTAAEAVAPIDEHRLGLTGWSYGGFMTMWGVTQTNRFRAAVAGAGIANWQSYYGENGIDAWMIPFFGASVYDDPQIYARSSPINFIKNVRTPTLEVVGERDIECPAPQTQEFWHALTDLGVTTEGVIYPGEGHGMRDPKHIEDFENRVVAWFDKYLK
jgi:dipeptidyl aminopeptidase/acylaminoacyl peptidase